MKPFLLITVLLVVSPILSQESRDYLIKLNKDTLFIKIIKLDKDLENVICEEKDKKVKFKAKGILTAKTGTVVFESALVRLKKLKKKRYIFLERTVSGNLNLYERKTRKGGWSLTEWARSKSSTVFFYKKENEPREKFSKDWKEKTIDCKLIHEKFNHKETETVQLQREIVRFYNTNCQ